MRKCLLSLLFLLTAAQGKRDGLTVEVTGGKVRGKTLEGGDIDAWLGIPYAGKPIGELRFQRPAQVEPWEGVLDATEQPNACQQNFDHTFGEGFLGTERFNPNTEVSEDCLYLNVHAPRDDSLEGPLPVLVWIYGGSYNSGSAALDLYRPHHFVRRGIVHVAMQYRVGVHGLLFMGKDSSAPGNVGMLDQVVALQWVQDNIASFGGNPDDVTLMGESAGANSVAMHLASPEACRLFSKAILQSGGLSPRWGYMPPKEARGRARKLAELLGCTSDSGDPEELLNCLRQVDPEVLRTAQASPELQPQEIDTLAWAPTKDRYFMKAEPRMLEQWQNFARKPLLLGSNENEGFWNLLYMNPLVGLWPNKELSPEETVLDENTLQHLVNSILAFFPHEIHTQIADQYAALFPTPHGLFNAFDQILGDASFVCPVESLARADSKSGQATIYRYKYAHRSSLDPYPAYTGVKHGDDLEFVFGTPLFEDLSEKYQDEEVALAEDIVNYWSNFVKTGSPNSASSPVTWPLYSPDTNWQSLVIRAESEEGGMEVVEDLFGDRCEFWKNIYEQFYQFKAEMESRMMEEKEEGLLMEEEVYEFPEEAPSARRKNGGRGPGFGLDSSDPYFCPRAVVDGGKGWRRPKCPRWWEGCSRKRLQVKVPSA